MDEKERLESLQRFRDGTAAFNDLAASLSAAELDHPDPAGGWTPRQVIHHMADGELVAALRLRNLVARQPEVPRQDEDALAEHLRYAARPVEASLALIRAVRDAGADILEGHSDAEWQQSVTSPTTGRTSSPESWLQVYANHPFNHAAQIRTVLGRE
jgi:hypothetical protein